jgi:hypothetical protein
MQAPASGNKCEKQEMFLKIILVKVMIFTPEWQISTGERKKQGGEWRPGKGKPAGGFRNSAYICILCLRK